MARSKKAEEKYEASGARAGQQQVKLRLPNAICASIDDVCGKEQTRQGWIIGLIEQALRPNAPIRVKRAPSTSRKPASAPGRRSAKKPSISA